MNRRQIIPILREFSALLSHHVKEEITIDAPGRYEKQAVEQFNDDLTEAGNQMKLVCLSNSVAPDEFDTFLEELTFPALLFYQEEGVLVPTIIYPDKKLRLQARQIEEDGTVVDRSVEALGEPYQHEQKIVFLTAFPFYSMVSETEEEDDEITPVKRLLNLLSTERRDIGYIYVYAVAVGLISLSLPLGTQAIVSFIAGGMWLNSVVLLIGLVVIGVLITGGLQIMQISMVEILQRRIFAKTAFEFAYRIPKINAEALSKYHAPELINRFFDILTLQKGLPKLLIDLSTAIIQIIFSLILLSFYHPFFVFFGLILVTLLVLIFYFTGSRGLASSIVESKYKYKVAFWLEELARALSSFKIAGTTHLPMQRTNENVNNYLIHRKIHFSVLIRQFSYIIIFKTLIVGGLLILGTILVIDRQITLGQFVASEIIIVLILGAVEKLIINMDTIYDMLTAVDKIGHVTDLPLEQKEGVTIPPTYFQKGIHIKTTDLSYGYAGAAHKSINNINLDITPGERLCITGYNGSGKSTLVNLLDGIYQSYEGTITYNNVSLRNLDLSNLRNKIARNVSQEDIFDGTVIENIMVGKPSANYQTALEAMEAVGIHDEINALPKGIDTHLVSGGKNLHTGLINKIILARCIAKRPKVLILNDFFHFFVQSEKQRLIDYLTAEEHEWTLIIVSADPVVVSRCTEIVVLKDGEIITRGDYDTVKEDAHFKEIVHTDISLYTADRR